MRPRERREPPRFVEKLTTMKTEEGAAIRFSVRALGDPAPNLTWLKDGRELPLAGRTESVGVCNPNYLKLVMLGELMINTTIRIMSQPKK